MDSFGRYTCNFCNHRCTNRTQFYKHIRLCSTGGDGNRNNLHKYACFNCLAEFNSRTHFNFHLRNCQRNRSVHMCKKCGKRFLSQRTLQDHRKQCVKGKLKCRQCQRDFENRKLLWRHQRRDHRGGGDEHVEESLQPAPWNDNTRPWSDEDGQILDEPLWEVYDTHKDIILQRHKTSDDSVRHTFNFPLTGLETADSIDYRSQLTYIYRHERNSFKVNLSFGIILKHIETGEYRYFVPYKNVNIFERPPRVLNVRSLSKIVRKIQRKSLDDHVLQQRPNTKWKPVFVTNVLYTIYRTSFVLGHSESTLPKWLKSKRCLALTSDLHQDHLCAFRCLAFHRKMNTRVTKYHGRTRQVLPPSHAMVGNLYREWTKASGIKTPPRNFKGLRVPEDVPLFEKTFDVSVNIYRLSDHGYSCVPLYLSIRNNPSGKPPLNMNCYEGHLSFITKMSAYARRYKCRHCDLCFTTPFNARRHEKSNCCQQTRLKFPGGYFSTSKTIFENLQDIYDIVVPEENRLYDFCAMIDGESLLVGETDEEISHNDESTKMLNLHRPVSISVCSNVPGYEDAKCFINPNVTDLLKITVEYLSVMAEKAKKITEEKLKETFQSIERKLGEMKVNRDQSFTNKLQHYDGQGDSDEDISTAMQNRLSKPNVFHSMLERLSETEHIEVDYNEWTDITEESVECHTPSKWSPSDEREYNRMLQLRKDLLTYCSQLPILGFNSSKYDLNLWKSKLPEALNILDNPRNSLVIKKQNQYLCISTACFKILDICQYLPPATSYSKFLSLFKISQCKGFFCYEYLKNYEILSEEKLPPIQAFWSSLKQRNTLEDDRRKEYEELCQKHPGSSTSDILKTMDLQSIPKNAAENHRYLQSVWNENGMKTLKDLLVWYNNLDVVPGMEAIQKMKMFYWKETGIDIFKETISVPGIARKLIFATALRNGSNFALFSEQDSDLYEVVKRGICGGPSIIFCRYHKAGVTHIRGNEERVCCNCIGYDCNALYLYCLGQEMPVGYFVRWLPTINSDKVFHPKKSEKYTLAYDWLDWESVCKSIHINHKLNSGCEKRIGAYKVDGFHAASKTIWEMNGCYWHGHTCLKSRNTQSEERYRKTMERCKYLESCGYKVISIWECEFRNLCETNEQLKTFLHRRQYPFFKQYLERNRAPVYQNDLLQAITEDTFFGMVLVDIHVPDEKYEYFSEMSPLYTTCKVPFSKIGSHMQNYAEEKNIKKHDKVLLVGGMEATELLLATPLLRWYLQHGLIVTRIHQAVEYDRSRCFKDFTEKVTEARRKGDSDPDLAIMGDIWKLTGNSAYGSLLLDRTRHQTCKYVHGVHRVKEEINNAHFISCSELDDSNYEVITAKKTVKIDIPNVLGFYVLQLAKLRILEFQFGFLDVFVSRADYQLIQTDTDSLYFALSGENLRDVIIPEKQAEFETITKGFCCDENIIADNIAHFIPRDCCKTHSQIDKRTPGLFKLESQGKEMIALNSKTYVLKVKEGEVKMSCKGLNKSNVNNPMETYHAVLEDRQQRSSLNIGFRTIRNSVYTYQQRRRGFSYFYIKREVQEDGISTRPLKMTLKPYPR